MDFNWIVKGIEALYKFAYSPNEVYGAAAVILKDGKILAVSRKDDPTDFGLPGGKVNPSESPEDACIRELREETGLVATELREIYTGVDDNGKLAKAFLILDYYGEIHSSEEGKVRWVNRDVLLEGSFKKFNGDLYKVLGV